MENLVLRSLNVIVVEDNPVVLQMVAAMMQQLGHCITTAGDGAEALIKFIEKPCELVLTDYEIPVINGYHLGRRIKLQSPNTKVIVMTAFSKESIAGLMPGEHIDAWLFKPFMLDDLRTAVNRVRLAGARAAAGIVQSHL